MGDDDEGDSVFLLNFDEKVGNLRARFAIECSRGFISQNNSGLVDERTSHRGALFLTTRQFTGTVAKTMAESHFFQQRRGSFPGGRFAFLPTSGKTGDEDVLHDGELWKEVMLLKDKAELAIAEAGGSLFIQ